MLRSLEAQNIKPSQLPPNRKVTYSNFVCTKCPTESELHRVRMTVVGDQLHPHQDIRSPAVRSLDAKIHLNSVFSDAHIGAQLCTADIKDIFFVLL